MKAAGLFGSELWKPALDKYAEATGLTVELFGADGQLVLASEQATPLLALFREHGYEPGLFAECARRCLTQTAARPAVFADEQHGLTVVGTTLVLEGEIAGAAVAGYALSAFSAVGRVQRWARSVGVPFARLWDILRQQSPVPERRLVLHGGLLQILGDSLLRENHKTRQYQEAAAELKKAAAAKDEFLAVLSHELRTPLAPIAGWASVLKKSESFEQVRRGAEAIERNALLQARMVDDLLDMSRVAHGLIALDLEILDLRAPVRAAAETIAQEIETKSLHLEIAGTDEPLPVEGDARRLQQVFGNVLSNAVKFTPAGGSIRVVLNRDGNDATVLVADTGKGIAADFLPFVFEIFRQQEKGLQRAQEGLGIGLSLVKRLTELHRGTVTITSTGPGRGTEVTVRLPLAAELPALDDASPVRYAPGRRFAGLAILVIEDSEDAREALRTLLELLGAQVAAAADGREALDLMARDAKPDVILCDLLMPRMDGFEFIGELHQKAAGPHPPVIAVSGLTSEASRMRTTQVGFQGHIKKPFDEAAVVAAVEAALARGAAPIFRGE